jgi:hypothetical protein
MRAGRAVLERAVDAVVEGADGIDWSLMTIELENEQDRELLRYLHLLARISDVQRTEGGVVDDEALRACAHAIVSRMPLEELVRAGSPAGDDAAPTEGTRGSGSEATTAPSSHGPLARASDT